MNKYSPLGALLAPPQDQPPFPGDLLQGKLALITGGSSGLGLAMAKGFAQAGANIAIMGRTQELLDTAKAELSAFNVEVGTYSCDVRNEASVLATFDALEKDLGTPTILANNAGANFPCLSEELSANAWRAVLRIAVDGTFLCSNEFARRCKSNNKPGVVINNSAQYIWSGFPADAHSATAKAAIDTMTRSMAREWREDGIRVNCIAAGFFPHQRATGGLPDEEGLTNYGRMFPIGRVGELHELGWLATFLASPLASGISGETLVIDGGDRLRKALMSPKFISPRERSNPWGELPNG